MQVKKKILETFCILDKNKNIRVKTLTLKTISFGEICEGEDNVFFNHLFIKILY